MLSIKGPISVCKGLVPTTRGVIPQSKRVERMWNRFDSDGITRRFNYSIALRAAALANAAISKVKEIRKDKDYDESQEARADKLVDIGRDAYLGSVSGDVSEASEEDVENVDYRLVERPTKIGRLMEAFEQSFWTDTYWGTGPRDMAYYNTRTDPKSEFDASCRTAWPIRKLAEWKKFELLLPTYVHAEKFQKQAKKYDVYDVDVLEKWERLRKVAARTAREERLKTSVQDLMQAYRQRMDELRKSEYHRNQLEKEAQTMLKVGMEQPYVNIIPTVDDEAQVKRIFSSVLPKLLQTHPITGNLTMVPKKTYPKRHQGL